MRRVRGRNGGGGVMIDMKSALRDELMNMGANALKGKNCSCSVQDLMSCGRDFSDIEECEPAVERVCPHCGETIVIGLMSI